MSDRAAEAERLAQALDAWDGVLMMPKGWRERTSTLLRSQAAELEALTWKLRVATETLERCRRVANATADCWRVDTMELEALRADAEQLRLSLTFIVDRDLTYFDGYVDRHQIGMGAIEQARRVLKSGATIDAARQRDSA